MKEPEEIARYTLNNLGPLRKWYNLEYKNAKSHLDQWLKVAKPDDMSDNELIRAFTLYDLEGKVVIYNYKLGLTKCHEEFSQPLILAALDLVLQEMGRRMTAQMHTEHPNVRRTHKIIMRANQMGECIMYIGPTTAVLADGRIRYAEEKIFADGGTFMTQGSEGCLAMLRGTARNEKEETMTEGIYDLCFLEVYNEFHDEIEKKIKQATREAYNRRIAVELTSYVIYCNKLLLNNGLNAEMDADDILQFMWRACPMMILNEMGYDNFYGEWNYDNGIYKLNIYF